MLFKLGVSGRKRCWLVLIVLWLIPRHVPAEESSIYVERLSDLGVTGGLCVMIGDDATSSITQSIGRTGRFLVQTLHTDAQQVSSQRGLLQATGMYGQASVDQLPVSGKLPYTENLVNLMVVRQVMGIDTPAQEISRVLCPRGVVLIANDLLSEVQLRSAGFVEINRVDQGNWLVARKPWNDGMDEWTHSRHSAAGNAVSSDVFVGPPRRVRWVVAAESEVPGLVTAFGYFTEAGTLTRYNSRSSVPPSIRTRARFWSRTTHAWHIVFRPSPHPGSCFQEKWT